MNLMGLKSLNAGGLSRKSNQGDSPWPQGSAVIIAYASFSIGDSFYPCMASNAAYWYSHKEGKAISFNIPAIFSFFLKLPSEKMRFAALPFWIYTLDICIFSCRSRI